MYGDQIDKHDARGNLVWRQTAFLVLEHPDVSWMTHGALRANNELSVLVGSTASSSDDVSLELWRLDSLGNIKQRRLVAWGGEWPRYAIDPEARDVLAGSFFEGDLVLMRVLADDSVQGNVIERDDYLELRPDGFELDADGAAYVTARAGGRDAEDISAMLCQLPVSGNVRCFTLGGLTAATSFSPLVQDLVVPEPGVVYVRTGADLRRYELPAP